MKGRDEMSDYKIVPCEPTEAMIRELMHEWDSVGATSMYDNYDAMLKVSPESDHIIVSKADAERAKIDHIRQLAYWQVLVKHNLTKEADEAIDKARGKV